MNGNCTTYATFMHTSWRLIDIWKTSSWGVLSTWLSHSGKIQSRYLLWYLAWANSSKLWLFVRHLAYSPQRMIFQRNFMFGYALVDQNQVFRIMNACSNDLCEFWFTNASTAQTSLQHHSNTGQVRVWGFCVFVHDRLYRPMFFQPPWLRVFGLVYIVPTTYFK